MRIRAWLAALAIVSACASITPDTVRADTHLERRDLIGAWRLVGMSYAGPDGRLDPFYQPDSTGILIYDASGWMSVQIGAPGRAFLEVPGARVGRPADDRRARLEAAAFNSYYAYFGTWALDERSSVITHHVASALIPAEVGADYSQAATLVGGRLVFTTRTGSAGREVVRTKTWERLPEPSPETR
jgi:hypothetical protein